MIWSLIYFTRSSGHEMIFFKPDLISLSLSLVYPFSTSCIMHLTGLKVGRPSASVKELCTLKSCGEFVKELLQRM